MNYLKITQINNRKGVCIILAYLIGNLIELLNELGNLE